MKFEISFEDIICKAISNELRSDEFCPSQAVEMIRFLQAGQLMILDSLNLEKESLIKLVGAIVGTFEDFKSDKFKEEEEMLKEPKKKPKDSKEKP